MPQPLGLRRETLPAAATAAETEKLRRSERYSFRIELVNGERFLGVTLGYVSALCGLFLYFPEANGDVVRCFVPAQAAKPAASMRRSGRYWSIRMRFRPKQWEPR